MSPKRCPKNRKGTRNPFCPYYGVCLNEAAKNLWVYLDCSECEFRTSRNPGPDNTEYTTSDPFPIYSLPFGLDNRY